MLRFYLLFVLVCALPCSSLVAGERPMIIANAYGKVVVGGDGKPLRGSSFTVSKAERERGNEKYLLEDSYWRRLKEGGFNAVRVAWFDPWQNAHGVLGSHKPWVRTDLNNAADLRKVLENLDGIVAKAEQYGMHVLLNYHNTGGYQDPDYSQPAGPGNEFPYLPSCKEAMQFWQLCAPRYKDRKHVFYELLNEYVRWRVDKFTEQHFSDTLELYRVTRLLAPETHIVLGSFPNHEPEKRGGLTMRGWAEKIEAMGVDFGNASIGFHPYNYQKAGVANPGGAVRELMQAFPAINTEQNFPIKYAPELETLDGTGLDGDLMGVQSMERVGMSWFHWMVDKPQRIETLWFGKLLPDAQAKGYLWFDWAGAPQR